MEWLFLPGAAIVLWLLVRSARQEQDAISLLHKVQHLEAEHARLLAFVKKELAELSQKRTEAQAARPVEPVEPAQPIRPVEPARPIRPVELAQPIQSVQSEEPVPVSVPSVPSFEAQPIPIAETAQPFPVALLSESVSETASLSSPPSASVDQIGPTGPIALATPKKAPGPPPTTPPTTPPGKPFDWEQLLGVRGAAWLGGIALLVAGTLFAKYSIENGLIGPEMRVALLVLLSLGLLSGSEFFMRPKYTVTANAVCGAGIAMLYVAFFAARVLYDLLPTWAAFLLMLLTTVLAVLLSLRYNTMYIAVLGLLGGFATPVSLSTGQDQPVGLFAYVLLLNFGFLWVAVKRLWHKLLSLSLAATLLLQTGWALVHLSPEKLPILVGTSALFALLYVAVTLFAKRFDEAQKQRLLWTATSASVWPFVFVFVLSLMPRYAQHWPQLVALLFCVNVGLLALAVERWALLAWPALFGTIVTELSWGLSWHVYTQSGAFVWIVAGVTILFAVLFGVGPWAYRWRKKTGDVPSELHLAAAGAGLWPLVVGVVLSNERFPQSHGVLFTWLFAAYVWLCVLGLRENRTLRMLLGAGCAAVAGTLWATDGLDASTLWGATGLVSVFAVVGNALPRFASQVQRQADAPHSSAWTKREHLFRELSGAVLLLGLIGFVGVELARELANPPGAFLCVEAVLFVLLGERSRVSGVAFVQGVVSLLYAVLLSSWLFWVFSVFAADGDLSGSRVLWEVSFVLGFAVALGIRAAVRANRRAEPHRGFLNRLRRDARRLCRASRIPLLDVLHHFIETRCVVGNELPIFKPFSQHDMQDSCE